MIPMQIDKNELKNYFVPYGDKAELEKKYIMLNNYSYKNVVYGIPSAGNVQGIVYNKKVFKDAGITEIPKTPDDFLAALQKIKDNTGAIPLYTNFAANWTMTAWDAYITGSATGDPDYANNGLIHSENPFEKREDMTGPYAVYYVLYEAVAKGLTEEDPTTTDWEGSKGLMNNGKIATMALGSWSVVQMQLAGDHGEDIGYMPFPITVDGKQYVSAAPDYNYGVNVNSSQDNQIASMLYVKWLTEESNFSYDQGGIPICVGEEYPDVYKMFDGVKLVIDNPAPDGEETLYNDINNDSEVGINVSPDGVSKILEAATTGSPTLDEIMADRNSRWSASQKKFGAIK
jgi:raffinose/stachyose/melibiose transport system substrate-binding protein